MKAAFHVDECIPTECILHFKGLDWEEFEGVLSSSITSRLSGLSRLEAEKCAADSRRLHATSETRSDDNLMLSVCKGDSDALASLFTRYAHAVRGIAYRVLCDASEADDLLQDIFILIQSKCRLFDPTRGPARFWILQVAYHSALGRRRYLNARHFYTCVDLADVENDLSDRGQGIGAQKHGDDALMRDSGLKEIFDGLSGDQQETLRLFFVEGYTLPEIATKLNQTHGNVKHHYFRGLEKLRKHVFNGKWRGNSAV